MPLHDWSKNTQDKARMLCDRLEKTHGLWIYPINIVIILIMIPFMFIELMTYSAEKKK